MKGWLQHRGQLLCQTCSSAGGEQQALCRLCVGLSLLNWPARSSGRLSQLRLLVLLQQLRHSCLGQAEHKGAHWMPWSMSVFRGATPTWPTCAAGASQQPGIRVQIALT